MSLEPLLHSSPIIVLHAAVATLAIFLGAVQLFRRKGDRLHRAVGRAWVALMAIVAGSGLFIWTIRTFWLFSPIHLLSIFVLVMLWRGVSAARRGDIARHRRIMVLTYLVGLILTGLLTLIPGRTMARVAFGPAGPTPGRLAAMAAIVAVIAVATLLVLRWRRTPAGRAFVARH
jgi:uncharacterized membrane protein